MSSVSEALTNFIRALEQPAAQLHSTHGGTSSASGASSHGQGSATVCTVRSYKDTMDEVEARGLHDKPMNKCLLVLKSRVLSRKQGKEMSADTITRFIARAYGSKSEEEFEHTVSRDWPNKSQQTLRKSLVGFAFAMTNAEGDPAEIIAKAMVESVRKQIWFRTTLPDSAHQPAETAIVKWIRGSDATTGEEDWSIPPKQSSG